MTVQRTKSCSASPQILWNKVFVSFNWQEWDPDIEKVVNADQGNFQEGALCTIVMKNGLHGNTFLHTVQPYSLFVYQGSFWSGALKYEASFSLQETSEGLCNVTYKFGLSGILGWLVSKTNENMIVHGVEKGLDNIVSLAEGA